MTKQEIIEVFQKNTGSTIPKCIHLQDVLT